MRTGQVRGHPSEKGTSGAHEGGFNIEKTNKKYVMSGENTGNYYCNDDVPNDPTLHYFFSITPYSCRRSLRLLKFAWPFQCRRLLENKIQGGG